MNLLGAANKLYTIQFSAEIRNWIRVEVNPSAESLSINLYQNRSQEMKATANLWNTKSMATVMAVITAFIRKHPIALAWMAGIICAGMVGCSDPAGPTDAGIARPGVGSTYIYMITHGRGGTSDVSYDTMIVSRSGLRIGGRTDVVEMWHSEDDGYGSRYTYLSYEPNGDVGTAVPTGFRLNDGDTAVWTTLPISSRTSKEISIHDDSPYADFPTVTFKSDYEGSDSVAVGSEKLVSRKISTVETFIPHSGLGFSMHSTTWYSSTIGNIVRWESLGYQGDRRELISYSLRP
jgi:hypothetical protein